MSSNIPSRKDWRGFYLAGVARVSIFPMLVFGWKVHRHFLPAGTRLTVTATDEVSRDNSPNRAMHTLGRLSVVLEDGEQRNDRVAGTFTPECPATPAGVTTLTALEDSEFWCFNYIANRESLPELAPVRLSDGAEFTLPGGQRAFICKGDVLVDGVSRSGPITMLHEQDVTLTAVGNVFGVLIEKDRK